MFVSKAARRYSEALFQTALGQGALDGVAGDLKSLARLADESPVFAKLLESRIASNAQKQASIQALFGTGAHPLTLRFLDFLIARHRIEILQDVCKDFEARHLEHARIQIVQVVSAQALRPEQNQAIRTRLGKRLGVEIRLEEKVDPSLIAGFRLRIGDRVEDHTAAAQIRRFHKAVLNATARKSFHGHRHST